MSLYALLQMVELVMSTSLRFIPEIVGSNALKWFRTLSKLLRYSVSLLKPLLRVILITIVALSARGNGILFANPIPEAFSMPKEKIDYAIDQAVREAAEQGVHGHANTPFILAKIKELTRGNSLPANRALIESNIAMAAKVAIEYSKLISETHGHEDHPDLVNNRDSYRGRAVQNGWDTATTIKNKIAREGEGTYQPTPPNLGNVIDPSTLDFNPPDSELQLVTTKFMHKQRTSVLCTKC